MRIPRPRRVPSRTAATHPLLDEASLLVLCGAYFFLALRRAYTLSRPRAALHALALSCSMLLVMQAYRLVLFLATFYSV